MIEQLSFALVANAGKDYDTLALVELQAVLFDTNISGSVVGIWGYDNFVSTEDYAGPFTSYSGNIKHFKATWSYCDTCWSVALGVTTDSGAALSFGQTFYSQIYSSKCPVSVGGGKSNASRGNNRFSCVYLN